jgi:oxygen-independent coproporphyrinogen-3 oxidase
MEIMQEVSSLYIHFPYCRHLCNYCDFYKHQLKDKSDIQKYEEYLGSQLSENKKFLGTHNYELGPLETVYIGGGTPSLWGLSGSSFLKCLDVTSDAEFTIEIDPGTWSVKEFDNWAEIGVNRVSVGIQSFDKRFLSIMDREHTMAEADELLCFLRDRKVNFSVDLMLGLPDSVKLNRNVLNEIVELIKYSPSHFSVYILKTRSNYLHNNKLPDEDYISDEYLEVCKFLEESGYFQYEVSNFAKIGRESKHNKKYWNYEPVAALGANATGLITGKDWSVRYQWKPSGGGYTSERLTDTPLKIEQIYMMLRVKNGLKDNYFSGENLVKFQNLKRSWSDRGYIKSLANGIHLSYQGFLVIDSLMDDMFKELSI